jgi:ArsR family transcriptional regulator
MDEERVAQARRQLETRLPRSRAQSVTEMFAAFADPTRLKLLLALSGGEMCVCDLAVVLGVSASAVSHQLRGLRALHLVTGRRDGKMNFYSLDDEHVMSLLDVGLRMNANQYMKLALVGGPASTKHRARYVAWTL